MGGGRGGERGSAVGAAVGWAARGIPTLCNEMGASGRKDPPSNPTTHPPQSTAQTPPCPSLPGTVTARPLFAKGVLFCPSRCQQSSQGMGGGTERGAVPGPPTPPKEPHWGVSTSTIRPCGPLTPSARGGLWLPSQPHVCPHPSPGGVRGVPTQCEVPGGAAQDPAQGLCTAGTAGSGCGWHCTTGTTMAQRGGRDGMGAVVANHGGCGGTGTTTAHHEGCDGAPWGP